MKCESTRFMLKQASLHIWDLQSFKIQAPAQLGRARIRPRDNPETFRFSFRNFFKRKDFRSTRNISSWRKTVSASKSVRVRRLWRKKTSMSFLSFCLFLFLSIFFVSFSFVLSPSVSLFCFFCLFHQQYFFSKMLLTKAFLDESRNQLNRACSGSRSFSESTRIFHRPFGQN